ncbi:Nramp family divalent metal transporter [Geomesophilobacter sediminis]|uniref:Nramp family divalent metal transporter n=1 Tax=Geomesophilobacter sediminis TaxID=2798584 RepID=A0A8J7LTN3_9BACT|nr:Nramp family divalent metal transporter [Geomesophilobacter sediminis]MBJ6723629.1 Nramp family divalent metal transporter [Geomesophilobacter sediminis]
MKRLNKRSILLFLSVIGPGIITANVDNDAGGIATYSVAGAQFGYSMLWTLLPITVALIVVQEMCARMGVVSGKSLADMIRENFGVKTTAYLMLFLVLADLGNTIAEFAGWASAMEVFGVSKYISVPIGAFLVWWLIVKGSYRFVEKVFLFACTIYFTYIASAFLAHPPWGKIMVETVSPSFDFKPSYLMMLIGIVGTTIAPWMQFYIQSAVVEKGIRVEDYGASRLDVIVGCIITDLVAFFIIVACGATLFVHHVQINDAKDAAVALQPLAGKYASALFAVGLANASLFAASILPLATAYYVCEAMGWESGVDHDFKSAPQFMWLYTGLIVIGALCIMIPNAPLVAIMLISQVVNGALLPFVLIFMLILINKPELMGEHVNSKTYNLIAWITVAVMIVLTLALVVQPLIS